MKRENDRTAIVASRTVRSFFHQLVTGAVSTLELRLTPTTEFYLVNLLCEFTRRQKAHGASTDLLEEPLFALLKRAQEGSNPDRIRLLKQLGDVSLYVSGFFSESLNRKLIDIDYYMNMGGSAYGSLAHLTPSTGTGRTLSEMFGELSRSFRHLVGVLEEVSEHSAFERNEDLLRLYERWVHTGSERLHRKLVERGVQPISVPTGFKQ